jgi:ribosome-associated toxin RatA of RatAB toxin-antitoxin module
MPVVESRIEIAASQTDVFDLAQDYGLRLEWDPFLRRLEFPDGAVEAAAGARVRVRARNGFEMDVVYLTLDRPRSVAMRMVAGPFFFERFAGTWLFDAIGPGRTRVAFKYGFETRWPVLRRVLDPIIDRVFARDIRRRLEGLRHAAETPGIIERLRRRSPC